jgi:hypothetical protein
MYEYILRHNERGEREEKEVKEEGGRDGWRGEGRREGRREKVLFIYTGTVSQTQFGQRDAGTPGV